MSLELNESEAVDSTDSTTSVGLSPSASPSPESPSAVETPSSSLCEPTPVAEDEISPRRRATRTTVTLQACTACRKGHKKCDGEFPCNSCSRHRAVRGAGRSAPVCTYEMNTRDAKTELQRENDELWRQKAVSDQIFHALRSDRQVSNILHLLKDHEDLALIAKVANAPSIKSSVNSPSTETSIATEELFQSKVESEDGQGLERATAPSKTVHPWIATSYDEQLIKHLFSLYWTWIHPVYLIFSMEQFIEGYETGNEEHCSAFLVAAVCAAACDLLGPELTSATGTVPDVAALRRDLVAEAMRQEERADRVASTWLDASRVMMIVNSRSYLTPATGFVQDGWV